MTFGKRLKKLRTDRGITQLQLSEILGTAKSNISKYESDTIEPNFTMLAQLSDLFNVSADYLLGISDTPSINSKHSASSNKILPDRLETLLSEDSSLNMEFYSTVSRIPIDIFKRYIAGEEAPGAYELCKLIEVFNTSADYLFGKTDTIHPNGSYGTVPTGELASRLLHEMDGNLLETELAEKLGISISTLKDILTGKSMPEPDLLFQIAQILGKSTDYLIGIAENSRAKGLDGSYPFIFSNKVSERITRLMDTPNTNGSYWADTLSLTEEEVFLLKKYGFVAHISTLSKLADELHVSLDYLAGRSDAEKTLQKSEEPLLIAYRNLNEENQSIAYGEVLKLKKDQEREEYMRSATSVAADEVSQGTGTDGLGK